MPKTVYLANAFSVSMLGVIPQQGLTLKVRPISLEEAKALLRNGFVSAVGHQSTAEVVSLLLGVEVPSNRISIALSPGDRVVVFQLAVRLAEGQILTAQEVQALYQGGKASFAVVEVVDQ